MSFIPLHFAQLAFTMSSYVEFMVVVEVTELCIYNYTPGIYADGYIVFAFPFVRSYVRSFVRGICVKVLR